MDTAQFALNKELLEAAKDAGYGIYPEFDFMYLSNEKIFDGISLRDAGARTIDNRYASKKIYDATYQEFVSFYDICVTPSMIEEYYARFTGSYKGYNPIGISVSTMGSDLNSDFGSHNPTNREDAKKIISEILEFRAVKKLLSTYIEPFPSYVNPRTGRVHTTFNQALTATGRLSSSKPNLQNIPIRTERGKEIRNAFIPGSEDGVILSADYSQIELRIMAHLSGDAHLTEAFRAGLDVHAITASKIFGTALEDVTPQQRRIAKTANFGIMYGISAFGLAQRLGIPRGEAKKIIDDYFANFPAISSYIGNTVENARRLGYVETLFGRRRYLPDINSRNANVKALAERNAVNAPIQGTSADIIKLAMVEVGKEISERHLKSRMVLQIHDELVFDVTGDEIGVMQKIVTEKMENVISLSVPLTVECNYGKTWLEAH